MRLNYIHFLIVLIIIYMLRLNDYLSLLISSIGFPIPPFQELYLLTLTLFYYNKKSLSKNLKVPFIFYVLLFFIYFLFSENVIHEAIFKY